MFDFDHYSFSGGPMVNSRSMRPWIRPRKWSPGFDGAHSRRRSGEDDVARSLGRLNPADTYRGRLGKVGVWAKAVIPLRTRSTLRRP
jgi:hypothetical protein